MNYLKLKKLNTKLLLKIEDFADLLNITRESARVQCSRYVKKNLLIRLKNNNYIFTEKWQNLGFLDYLKISNFLQVPSYISFMSALMYYEVSTQIQRNYIEAVCLKRTKIYNIKSIEFNFYKIKNNLYFGFNKVNNIFIANKEKAFLDCVYFFSYGKYSFDMSSIDLKKLDENKVVAQLKEYPDRIQKKVETLWNY